MLLLALFLLQNFTAVLACTTVIVGKNRSTDGSVLVIHNEDLGENAAHKVVINKRQQWKPGDKLQLFNGTNINQSQQSFRFVATSIFEKSFYPGDYTFGVNENKLAATNNTAYLRGIKTYEESVAYKNPGGIIWTELTQLALERGVTARDTVKMLGALVEQYGLSGDSATMMAIADAEEGWWMEIAGPGQWAAKRVGDNEAIMRANAFRIAEIDFHDSANWLFSAKIVDYAKEKGWYSGGAFSFKDAYTEPERNNGKFNVLRQQRLDALLAQKSKISISDLAAMMRDVYAGTEYYITDANGSPFHNEYYTIANMETEISAMVALNAKKMPQSLCMWTCMANPATGIYLPFHLQDTSVAAWYSQASAVYKNNSAYWQFTELARLSDLKYSSLQPAIAADWQQYEQQFMQQCRINEKAVEALYQAGDTDAAAEMLTAFDADCAKITRKELGKLLSKVKTEVYWQE
jgi:dipeptidase